MMKALPAVIGLCSLATAALPAAVSAAGPIEEIVVTGEFREARLLDTPVSVSVVSLADSTAGTVNHLEEILGL